MPYMMDHPKPLAPALERNITTLLEVGRQMENNKTRQDRLADAITAFTGRISFVYIHIVWFAAWTMINTGLTPLPVIDPFPFGLLTMIVSLEAIFLSTFVLISQNRMAELAGQRADLDLQINLLAEYEITKVLRLVDAIADHLKLKEGGDLELEELKNEIHPVDVLRKIEQKRKEMAI